MRFKRKDFFRTKRWFAWHPVTIGDCTVWLEWVERRWSKDPWACYYEYRFIGNNDWS